MSVVGDVFHGIGNILSGHSWGSTGGAQTATQTAAPTVVLPAAPTETPAPQQSAQGSRPNQRSQTPSFLAAAAMPNQAGSTGQSNVSGKGLLGD